MKAIWVNYPNFSKEEFDCSFTKENEMTDEFMKILQAIRTDYGKPMRITSGFRSTKHPIEARKTHSKGEHTQGNCCDIACSSSKERFTLIQLALKHGITRIGVAKTFLHFGIGGKGLPNHVIWDYK